jgi:TIR domain
MCAAGRDSPRFRGTQGLPPAPISYFFGAMKGASIFISYASEHKAIAERIAFSLRGSGFKVFLDKDDLPPGSSFDEQIKRAIGSSEAFIFLVSPEALADGRYTMSELKFARAKWPNPSRSILPVMVAPTEMDQLPEYLKAVSILTPQGNIGAEVNAALAHMTRRVWRAMGLAFACIAVLAAAMAYFYFRRFGGIQADPSRAREVLISSKWRWHNAPPAKDLNELITLNQDGTGTSSLGTRLTWGTTRDRTIHLKFPKKADLAIVFENNSEGRFNAHWTRTKIFAGFADRVSDSTPAPVAAAAPPASPSPLPRAQPVNTPRQAPSPPKPSPIPLPGIRPVDTSAMKLIVDAHFARGLFGFRKGDDARWLLALQKKEGEFQMVCRESGVWWPSEPPLHGLHLKDFVCEVWARIAHAENTAGWGLGFIGGVPDSQRWSGVMTNASGQISSHPDEHDGDYPWMPTPAMRPGQVNALRVEAFGPRLRVFVNGSFVFERWHERQKPDNALTLYCFGDHPPEDIRFHSVQVWTPPDADLKK